MSGVSTDRRANLLLLAGVSIFNRRTVVQSEYPFSMKSTFGSCTARSFVVSARGSIRHAAFVASP
jgi:hypothetical protein